MDNKTIAYIAASFGSFGTSILAFIQHHEIPGIVTALAGCVLTIAMSYEKYQDALLKKEQVRSLKLENDRKALKK